MLLGSATLPLAALALLAPVADLVVTDLVMLFLPLTGPRVATVLLVTGLVASAPVACLLSRGTRETTLLWPW